MKNLERLNGSEFLEFKNNELSQISEIVGGAKGNTRGGFDWREKCSKRRCDKPTTVCADVANG